MQREIDAVGLRAVAQRGVEQIEAFAAHVGTPGACAGQRLLHRGVGQPFAVDRHGVALHGDIAALEEKSLGVVAGIDRETFGAASAGELFQRLAQHRRHALPGRARMHVEHVDMIGALQRGKSDRRILQRGDQREFGGQPLAELLFVIGRAGPGLLLRFAVILAGQLLDRGNEDRRQDRRIGREKRPQSGFWQRLSHASQCSEQFWRERLARLIAAAPCRRIACFGSLTVVATHRAISQVVPSLESLIDDDPSPRARSRMRSDSLKSLRARAAVAI